MKEESFHARPDFVHDVFAHIAKRYDLMNTVLSFNQHKRWRRFAMRQMRVQSGFSCLDVATGTGDFAIALAQAVGPGGRVVGVDFCREMLEVGEQKLRATGVAGRTELLQGNAMALTFSDDSFDCATIGFALRNVPDIRQVLREMTRVVKPGAIVVSLELSKPEWKPFKALYYAYFNHVLPLFGRLAVGRSEPYRWLPESLKPFPGRRELALMFEEAGLVDVRQYPLTGGICALHIGHKPG